MSRNFDGADDKIEMGDFQGPQTGFTAACWINTDSVTGAHIVFSMYDLAGIYSQFFTNGTGFNGRIENGLIYIGRAASSTVSIGEWSHIAYTWDGGTSSSSIKLYKNSNRVDDADDNSGTFLGPDTATITRRLGVQSSIADPNDFDGLISHFELFTVPLSSGEIKQIMRFPGSLKRGHWGYWPLWGSSSPEPDYSGNKNNGTVTGAIKGASDPPINGIFTVPKPELIHVF